MDVEEFGRRLIKYIARHPGSHAYVLTNNLVSAIQLALDPGGEQGQQFPRMLFKPGPAGGQEETRVVKDDEELHQALEQGWRREPAPKPVGYPQLWVEVPIGRGTNYRSALIRNRTEEETFKKNVNLSDWVQDDYVRPALGGRPTNLDTLVEEHKQRLHQQLDEELLRKGREA